MAALVADSGDVYVINEFRRKEINTSALGVSAFIH
jgi:hypothetical protein